MSLHVGGRPVHHLAPDGPPPVLVGPPPRPSPPTLCLAARFSPGAVPPESGPPHPGPAAGHRVQGPA